VSFITCFLFTEIVLVYQFVMLLVHTTLVITYFGIVSKVKYGVCALSLFCCYSVMIESVYAGRDIIWS